MSCLFFASRTARAQDSFQIIGSQDLLKGADTAPPFLFSLGRNFQLPIPNDRLTHSVMYFDFTLPHPLPEVDPQLFNRLLDESKHFVKSHDYRVMSNELPIRFLDFWVMPTGRTNQEIERYRNLYKSKEKGVLLQLPLYLFTYVYYQRFRQPDILNEGKAGEPVSTDAGFRSVLYKRFHQFHALLQYIRIFQGMGLENMVCFDLFDVEAYDEVQTDILVKTSEFFLLMLDEFEKPCGSK